MRMEEDRNEETGTPEWLEETVRVLRSLRELRELILENFHGSANELTVTLTYRENMQDPFRLEHDQSRFLSGLDRYTAKHMKNGHFEYVAVRMRQRRGAWYLYLLLKFPYKKQARLPKSDVERLWGQGFVKISRIYDSAVVADHVWHSCVALYDAEEGIVR